jgi:hypothetical protein
VPNEQHSSTEHAREAKRLDNLVERRLPKTLGSAVRHVGALTGMRAEDREAIAVLVEDGLQALRGDTAALERVRRAKRGRDGLRQDSSNEAYVQMRDAVALVGDEKMTVGQLRRHLVKRYGAKVPSVVTMGAWFSGGLPTVDVVAAIAAACKVGGAIGMRARVKKALQRRPR